MKQTHKNTQTLFLLLALILGFAVRAVPASAINPKTIIHDLDLDGTISAGDKYCLGDQCFYVLDNNDGKVRALAEYNLLTGFNLLHYTPDSEVTGLSEGTREYFDFLKDNNVYKCTWMNNPAAQRDELYCYQPVSVDLNWTYLGDNPEYQDLDYDQYDEKSQDFSECMYNSRYVYGWRYDITYCYKTTRNNTKIMQSPTAVSAHGDSRGDLLYPEIGDHFFNRNLRYYLEEGKRFYQDGDMFYDANNELIRDTYQELYDDASGDYYTDEHVNYIYEPIFEYKDNLVAAGYNVVDVDLLSYNDLADLLTAVNEKDMTFEHNGYGCENWQQNADGAWYCETSPWVWQYDYRFNTEYGYSSMLDYIPAKYSWIHSTSYWLKTGFWNTLEERYSDSNYQFFVDSLGDLCFVSNRSVCDIDSIGAGIRPVVTIAEDDFVLSTMSIKGSISWEDESDSRGKRPNKAKIYLRRNGVVVDELEVEGNNDVWEFSFDIVPRFDDDGNEYVYSIGFDDYDEYSVVSGDDFNIVYGIVGADINPSTDADSPLGFILAGIGCLGAGAVVLIRRRR